MRPLAWAFLGRVPYARAAALQEALRARILDGDEDAEALLLLEHDPVITLGRAAKREHVLAGEAQLRARGVTLAASTRGGDVTYHGPGQLVAYPVLRLQRGIVAHVEAMAQAAIAVAAAHGVAARFRRDCPGVWVGGDDEARCGAGNRGRKLAAFGVHVHRRVAIHGVALNVSTALEAFDLIVPCGIRDAGVTSIARESGRGVDVEETAAPFARAFAAALGRGEVRAESLLSRLPDVEWTLGTSSNGARSSVADRRRP